MHTGRHDDTYALGRDELAIGNGGGGVLGPAAVRMNEMYRPELRTLVHTLSQNLRSIVGGNREAISNRIVSLRE